VHKCITLASLSISDRGNLLALQPLIILLAISTECIAKQKLSIKMNIGLCSIVAGYYAPIEILAIIHNRNLQY